MSDELSQAFYAEAEDILGRIEKDFSEWIRTGSNGESLQGLFRGVHTIKGNSSFLNLPSITKLAHQAENILDLLRKDKIKNNTQIIELLLEAMDGLRILIVEKDDQFSSEVITQKISEYIHSISQSESTAVPTRPQSAPTPSPATPSISAAVTTTTKSTNVIRVEESKVDKIIDLSQELELSRFLLEQLQEAGNTIGDDKSLEWFSAVGRISRISRSLAGIVHGVRLVAVGSIFQRFPRVVKEIAGKLNKDVDLQIIGGETELDKSIVDAISEPLTHMIRNSLDHGIETPEIRQRKGKNSKGRIVLSSYVKGNYVFIDIKDDGAGINAEKVGKKALEKGLITQAEHDSMSETDKRALIFAAGFSTAETVSDISGRGVGMDVVRTNIARLNGSVLIDSVVDQGTTIHLRFPLSKVVRYSLFVKSCERIFSFPLDCAIQSLDLPLIAIGSQKKDNSIPVFSLEKLRSLSRDLEAINAQPSKWHVIFFYLQNKEKIGIQVDEYISTEEAVVQAVDSFIAYRGQLQGATIRKDGSVCPMIDLDQLFSQENSEAMIGYVDGELLTVNQAA